MANVKHGTLRTKALAIKNLDLRVNQFGKVGIITEVSEFNAKGNFQLTEKHLENICQTSCQASARLTGLAIARGNASYETSELNVTFKWCEAGEPIGVDADGNDILNSNGSAVFEKSHWRTESIEGITLAESAAEFIYDKLADAEIKYEQENRKLSRTEKKAAPRRGEKAIVQPDVTSEDEDEDEDLISALGGDVEADKPE